MIIKQTKTLEERGLPSDSFFTVHLSDGSVHTEHETNWSDMSEVVSVEYFGRTKTVMVIKGLSKITVQHGKLQTELEIPEDCQVYQAVRSESLTAVDGVNSNRIIGRVVGLVRDGSIIEERFLDATEGRVRGLKK